MSMVVAILTFLVSILFADFVDDRGLHGTAAAWVMGAGTIAAVIIAVSPLL